MKTIEKVKIEKLALPVGGVYNYNAAIYRSADGGKSFYYCGSGKYFETAEEAEKFKKEIEK